MKKWLFIYITIQLLFVSCFDDDSNKTIKALNPIVIENVDFKENQYYSLFVGDTLKIEPLIYCEGIPDAELSFEWKLFGGTLVPTVIDSTMYLCAAINVPADGYPYSLRLTIKDKTTGIIRIETCNVTVLNPFGEGILVADTKDGINSDLSLVMSREFSSQIPRENDKMKIFRNVWSVTNNVPIPGLVLDASSLTYGQTQNRSLTLLTTETILRADYHDFVNISSEEDENLFPVLPEHIGHGYQDGFFSLYTGTSHEIMCANGKITTRGPRYGNRKYSYTFYPAGSYDYNVTMMYGAKYYPTYAYDALGKRMIFFTGSGCWTAKEQLASNAFDVCDLSDYEPFFMGETSQGITMLAKKLSTGAYMGLVMYKTGYNRNNYARTTFDFTDATDINQAKFFELNKRENVVYYATDNKLYATPTININSKVQWTAEPGDKITGIKIYDWAGGNRGQEYISGNESITWFKSSTDRMIMVTTYNESTKEGKITCIPIVTYGVGGLEQNKDFHVVLHNFNEILGIYKQLK